MPQSTRWTEAMRTAWSYALSSVEKYLSGREGLRQFRSGGGVIRDADWFYLRRRGIQQRELQEGWTGFDPDTPIPIESYATVGWKDPDTLMAHAKVRALDLDSGEMVTRVVGMKTDTLMSPDDINQAILGEGQVYGLDTYAPGSSVGAITLTRGGG